MTGKLVYATELREGSYVKIDGAPCVVRKMDVSKTGKHGASKVRIEAVGILDDKKRITVMPGHERLEIPLIEKKKGQILSINKEEKKASIMDVETFETTIVSIPEELNDKLQEGMEVEYWTIEEQNIIKRIF